jgi:hypothetical protein
MLFNFPSFFQLLFKVGKVEVYQEDDGNGELGLDSGERALKTAVRSKGCSRRVNYPMLLRVR